MVLDSLQRIDALWGLGEKNLFQIVRDVMIDLKTRYDNFTHYTF